MQVVTVAEFILILIIWDFPPSFFFSFMTGFFLVFSTNIHKYKFKLSAGL